MFNISLYTYVQIKHLGSHLSHHQCEMFEENLTQVTGYATAHILHSSVKRVLFYNFFYILRFWEVEIFRHSIYN